MEQRRGSGINRSVFVKPSLGCSVFFFNKKASEVKGRAVRAAGTWFRGVFLTF